MPSSRALNGARVPSAIIWKPVTLPTASQTSLRLAGHEGAGVRPVLPSVFAGTGAGDARVDQQRAGERRSAASGAESGARGACLARPAMVSVNTR